MMHEMDQTAIEGTMNDARDDEGVMDDASDGSGRTTSSTPCQCIRRLSLPSSREPHAARAPARPNLSSCVVW
jgi:hypothetical protein